MNPIEKNLELIRGRVRTAADRAGRDPDLIRLVAVSKKRSPEAIRNAWDAGQKIFGESRVQEALEKIPLLPAATGWEFIGHLQTNKIRRAMPHFSLFHGVDSPDIARQMDRIAQEEGLFPRVLLEINVAGEASKFGFSPELVRAELDALLALPRLQIVGVMTMAPYDKNPGAARPFFAALRTLRDDLEARAGIPLPEISMGMSGDFEAAIAEGTTIVRIGSAVFDPTPSGLNANPASSTTAPTKSVHEIT